MACAANYAWVNRASMTFLARQAFAKTFAHCASGADDLSRRLEAVFGSVVRIWEGAQRSGDGWVFRPVWVSCGHPRRV